MPKRILRRGLVVLAAPVVVIGFIIATTTTASAHEVTDITATCEVVTVHFSGFPQAGVVVHIAATVEGHGTLSRDVVVNDTTTQATLDIASATSALHGATASVVVNVSWEFEGPQHVQKTLTVTCGTATTTMPTTSTTMIGVSGETSTSVGSHNSTTTTSGSAASGHATSTVAAAVSAGSETSTTNVSGVLGASVNASPTATGAPRSSLPFTGTATLGLVILGLAAMGAGTALVLSQRRRSTTS